VVDGIKEVLNVGIQNPPSSHQRGLHRPDRWPGVPLPRRRGVLRGRLPRVFTPSLACAIAEPLGAPWLPSRGSPLDAAGFPGWYGLRACASCSAGYAASPHGVTPGQREPATRLSGDDCVRTCTGQLSVPFRAHQRVVGRLHGGRLGQAKDLCHTVKSHAVANSETNSGCSLSKDSGACGLYPILEYHFFRNSLLGCVQWRGVKSSSRIV